MLENYYLRRPTMDDIHEVHKLMTRCDQRDIGFVESDLSEIQSDWGEVDLSQDAWLAIDRDNVLQGYGIVMPWSSGKRIEMHDAPGSEGSDLFLSLTVLCEGRARFLLKKENNPEKQSVVTYVSDSVEHQKKVLTDAGYAISKFVFNLHRDLEGENPAPEWPEGIVLRTMDPESDASAVHTLVQDAFEKPGHSRQPFEEWKSFMMGHPLFDPLLWFLLEEDSELIGCALCFKFTDGDSLGWVRQLAVRADQRGKGFGRKLLQHAFHVFKGDGFQKAGVAVESENENALKLYFGAGMHKAAHLDEFSKRIISDH